MTETFGHSDNLITLSLSLSLSQALAYKRDNITFLFYARVARVNIRLFLRPCKRSRLVFLSPSDDCGGDDDRRKETNSFNSQ